MIERLILETLNNETEKAVENSSKPDIPVKFLGVTFVPPDDQKYIEIVHIPNNPEERYWSRDKVYRGLFRIILHWINDGSGPYEAMDLLAEISNHFVKNGRYGPMQILNKPDFTGVLEEGKGLLYPVNVRYQAFEKG